MKRFISLIVALFAVAAVMLTSCNAAEGYMIHDKIVDYVPKDEAMFTNADRSEIDPDSAAAVITLSGAAGEISDTSKGSGGDRVIIKTRGIYRVTGSSVNVSITVDDPAKSGSVYLVLDNVSMKNDFGACISVKCADKLIIYAIGENSLVAAGETAVNDPVLGSNVDGAIFSKDNLTVNGAEGSSLLVSSSLKGIVVKDDLKITGSVVSIRSDNVGVEANDSVRIGGGILNIASSEKEGVVIKNSEGNSYCYAEAGKTTITSKLDGLKVKGKNSKVVLAGGVLEIEANSDSDAKDPSLSQKGIVCDGDVMIGKATVKIVSADDGINCGDSVSLTDGQVNISTYDDGIHADDVISVSGGNIEISRSYEGLEAHSVTISGGKLSVKSSDDGINAAGDTSDSDVQNGALKDRTDGKIFISGGEVLIDSGKDGLDSSGSLFVSGGRTVVEGSVNVGGKKTSVTGGSVIILTSVEKAVNFNAGAQCSALLSLGGNEGTTVSARDGEDFSFKASKAFGCVVYSSPSLKVGGSCEIVVGTETKTAKFLTSYYYSDVE